nr:MAG TPA: hypothetical protein [Caudoviricetes sp.]
MWYYTRVRCQRVSEPIVPPAPLLSPAAVRHIKHSAMGAFSLVSSNQAGCGRMFFSPSTF